MTRCLPQFSKDRDISYQKYEVNKGKEDAVVRQLRLKKKKIIAYKSVFNICKNPDFFIYIYLSILCNHEWLLLLILEEISKHPINQNCYQ